MKSPRPFHRFLSLFLASLLLLTGTPMRATVGHSSANAVPVKKAAGSPVRRCDSATTNKTAKAGKTTPAERGPAKSHPASETTVSATSFEAIVTMATAFDFGPMVLPLPASMVLIWSPLRVARWSHHQTPHYFFACLRHVFGHFIAPNAP